MDDKQPGPALPKHADGSTFRARVVGHRMGLEDGTGAGLELGAVGYDPASFVVLACTELDRRRFPIGTEFELVCVEETRGVACPDCGGSGHTRSAFSHGVYYPEARCGTCDGTGRSAVTP